MSKTATAPAARPPRRKRVLLTVVIALLILMGLLLAKAAQIRRAAEAYLFGYPLVIMDVTRSHATQSLGPENHLYRVRRFPDASFHDVVRPNVDTLYTSAFIDMAKGPWVFEMPANRQRYEVMPFMDAWTNIFATPGTRSTGTAGGQFLLAGPSWQGAIPTGLTLLRAPTQMVWLIGRTQTNGAADYPIVHALQDGLRLRSLAAWQAGRDDAAPPWQAAAQRAAPPIEQMQAMRTEVFFTRLAALMADNPPGAADEAMMTELARLGMRPGHVPEWGLLESWSLRLGRWIADVAVARELKKPRGLVRGWATPPAILGDYGSDYATRAAVAMVGLGANLPPDAMYPNTRVDQDGKPLDGSQRYREVGRAHV